MKRLNLAGALLLALPMSTILAGCGGDGEDTADRRALEQKALERDLDLALQPDSAAVQPELSDLPLGEEPAPAEAAPAPEPARVPPRVVRREEPRRAEPRPEPRREAPAPRPAEPEAPRYATRTAPSGTTFTVSLNEEVRASQGVGETFTATLTEPLTDSNGNTVIPAGATVRGRVTSAQVSGRAGQGAGVGIDFTSISYGGETYPINGTVVNAPAARRVSNTSNVENAAKVAGGAAVGAVLGRVIGKDRRGAIAGAAVGAAAGTAVAIGTADVDAVIGAGSTATIRLDSGVSVRREL